MGKPFSTSYSPSYLYQQFYWSDTYIHFYSYENAVLIIKSVPMWVLEAAVQNGRAEWATACPSS